MAEFRPLIAKKLKEYPGWIRSFSKIKPQLDRMIEDGEVERIKPVGGAARNMVRLTDKGRTRWLGEKG